MLIGIVPTGRVREDYRLHIKDKRGYDIAVSSGVAWVAFENLPLSWEECKKEIEEYQMNLNKED